MSELTDDTVDRLETAVEKLEKIVFGNGKLGLSSKVEIMWRGGIYFAMLACTVLGGLLGKFIL